MKYILGIMSLITGMICYIYPDLIMEKPYLLFGCIFILIGDLFIAKKSENEK